MGYTHYDKLSAHNGIAIGVKGSETDVVNSSGVVTANVTGNVTGNLTETVTAVTGSTTATRAGGTAVVNSGIATLGSTDGQKNYTLAAPTAGVNKTLVCTAGSSANTCVVLCASGVTFDGTNTKATFNAANELLDLVGISTTQWAIKSNMNSVALATT